MAAGIIALIRAVAGPTFADRVISISSVISLVIFLMVLQAVTSGSHIYLDIAVVLMLLSFVGTLAIAKFIKVKET
ncbi:MAG: cation:proton antiporter [Candidatus Aenigmarchaeota archaeon]|nr:cation:proton antiporter [Candidatus Aenigmarchaeota archaeon]